MKPEYYVSQIFRGRSRCAWKISENFKFSVNTEGEPMKLIKHIERDVRLASCGQGGSGGVSHYDRYPSWRN